MALLKELIAKADVVIENFSAGVAEKLRISYPFLSDINPGAASSNPSELVDWNGITYFRADDGLHGSELWRTHERCRERLVGWLAVGGGRS